MDELARKLASVRGAVEPAWSEARAERLLEGVGHLRRKRRAQRVAVTGVASLAAIGLVYMSGLIGGGASTLAGRRSVPVMVEQARVPSASVPMESASKPDNAEKLAALPLKLADGSHVKALARGAAVSVENNEPKRVHLRLDAGGARFDVIPNKKREFTVRAGGVEVAVLGTIFEVERAQGRVRVSVSRGKVRVRVGSARSGEGSTAIVKMGESRWFEDPGPSEQPAPSVALLEHVRPAQTERAQSSAKAGSARSARHAAASSAARGRAALPTESPRVAWRSLSQSGDYEGAYRLLQESTVEDDDTGALLDAADAARLSGHPQAAVMYLRKVVENHRQSPVAPLAAFTLGRVLLERLGQPSEAADAFATARQLAPGGSLAQDALAREVEAWSKAGRPDDAYRRAQQYVETYPKGRRLRAVQLYGGL